MTTPTSSPQAPFNNDQVMFLRTMGHELRSPLNSILTTAEMMTTGVYGELQPAQSTAAQRILRNSYRLLGLINAVMLYIRAQSNAVEMRSVPVLVEELLKEQIAHHEERAAAKNLTVEIAVLSDMPETVKGDPDQIAFIVDELLHNAVTFTASGHIALQVRRSDSEHWVLTVTDTGIGIEPEHLPLVFTPFWRGRDAKQLAPDGHGLGLSIVHEIIHLMDGEIHIESQANQGTTVKVTLPATLNLEMLG